MSNEDILNEKKEILDTNVNQIRELSHLFYKCMNKNYFCKICLFYNQYVIKKRVISKLHFEITLLMLEKKPIILEYDTTQ